MYSFYSSSFNRVLLLAIISGVLSNCLVAQNHNYKFESVSEGLNLSRETINDLVADDQGFLWLATWSGVKRYDEYSVKTYRKEASFRNGLRGNKIRRLFIDSKNRLWLGSNYSGFYLYDRKTDKFIQYLVDQDNLDNTKNFISTIAEDSEGFLWIGTEGGLFRFNTETESFTSFSDSAKSISDFNNVITAVACEKSGEIWAGSAKHLKKLIIDNNSGDYHYEKYDLAPDGSLNEEYDRHNYVNQIVRSKLSSNTLWLGTSLGFKKFTFNPIDNSDYLVETYTPGESAQDLSHSYVSDIFEDEEKGEVWIGTFSGLNLYNINSKQFKTFTTSNLEEGSISNNKINNLYKDAHNILWIATDKGFNKLNLSGIPFNNYNFENSDIRNPNITCMKIDSENPNKGFWFGTEGSGIGFVPVEDGQILVKDIIHYPLKTNYNDLAGFVSNILITVKGDIWLSTKGAGLIKIQKDYLSSPKNAVKNLIQYNLQDSLEDDYIMSLAALENGSIFFGYWDNGIGFYDDLKNRFTHFSHTSDGKVNLGSFPVKHISVYEDNGKTVLWVAREGDGLMKLEYEKSQNTLRLIKHYNSNTSDILDDYITGILKPKSANHSDQLWLTTEDGISILDLENESFSHITDQDGIENTHVQSLIEDSAGTIWISTLSGLAKIDGSTNSYQITNYNSSAGLAENLFAVKSALLLDSGKIVFGGTNGFSYFNPKNINQDTIPPQIILKDFSLFNESIEIGQEVNGRIILEENISVIDEITLYYNENVLSIEFQGLKSDNANDIKYAYMLEGFNDEWIYADTDERIAYFTNLPYRTFTFRVKASTGSSEWSQERTLSLTVLPPFWLTKWAYALYFLLACALIYFLFYVANMRVKFNHSLELERLEREKLEDVNKMKLQFFTNISHELRTPLTMIITPLQQLIKQKNTHVDSFKSFVRMHKNANKLLLMINQLLDIRKNEEGILKLKYSSENIIEFTKEISLSFQSLADSKNIDLYLLADKKSISASFDIEQMEKVIYNLLSNAIKFTPEKGRIEIKVIEKSDYLYFYVNDTGSGINDDEKELIFDRFHQAENGIKGHTKGSGIGLALAKSIIEAHEGRIWVEDNPLGQGSEFIFTLPLEIPANALMRKIGVVEDALPEVILIEAAVDPSIAPEAEAIERPIIMIVEDNADIRSYISENLEPNYKIIEAENGAIGLKKAIECVPDLIVADISMPEMDGIKMCSLVKSNVNTSHIPVILLTARTSLIYQIDGMEKGADDYITKPFNMELLQARIKNLINSRNHLKEKFTKNFDLSPSGLAMNSLDDELLNRIKTCIEANLDNSNFTVDQLAKTLHFSRMQLYRKLKALTNKSPNKIIKEFRIKRAAQLLETKKYNVADVTYMVGYNDLKYFRDQFKKEFGVNPSSYVKDLKD